MLKAGLRSKKTVAGFDYLESLSLDKGIVMDRVRQYC